MAALFEETRFSFVCLEEDKVEVENRKCFKKSH